MEGVVLLNGKKSPSYALGGDLLSSHSSKSPRKKGVYYIAALDVYIVYMKSEGSCSTFLFRGWKPNPCTAGRTGFKQMILKFCLVSDQIWPALSGNVTLETNKTLFSVLLIIQSTYSLAFKRCTEHHTSVKLGR